MNDSKEYDDVSSAAPSVATSNAPAVAASNAALVAASNEKRNQRELEQINVGKNSCVRILRKYISLIHDFQDKYVIDQNNMLYFSSPAICPSVFDGIELGEHVIAVAIPVVSIQPNMLEGSEFNTQLAPVEASTGKAMYKGIVTMRTYQEQTYIIAYYNHEPKRPTLGSLINFKTMHVTEVLASIEPDLLTE